MTILKCSATKCMYNENELCSRGDIEITGAGARNADETTAEVSVNAVLPVLP